MISRKSSRITGLCGQPPERRFGLARLAMVIASLILSACAPVDTRPLIHGNEAIQSAREAALTAAQVWDFSGRLAISQADAGGNARIEWHQDGANFDIRLSAPITGQSWRLTQLAGSSRLQGVDGGPREGNDPEQLLLEATGWRIPVKAMAAWVRGARAAGPASLSFDGYGLPARIEQDAWSVEYRGWFPGTPPLPSKLFVRQGKASVKLVVEKWGQR